MSLCSQSRLEERYSFDELEQDDSGTCMLCRRYQGEDTSHIRVRDERLWSEGVFEDNWLGIEEDCSQSLLSALRLPYHLG